ncbi:uncharacterized protein [Mytilus edulis]|uniref:uncharacterized protein n=1 Tax=Mytilus edulis TaxID=6550 RepID=UPI0039EE7919
MYSSKVHRSIFNSTFFDGTLIQFKSWVYYTSILNNDPISSSYLSTNITNTQTPDMTVLSTYTDTSITEPYLTTKLLSNTEIMTSSLQPTTVFNTKDELISKDFNSTIDKKSRITKSFQATSFIDLSTTELQMSSQLVQISFDYTTRLSYETVEKISSTAWSSNTHNLRSTHRLLHSDNQYSFQTFMLNNSQHSTHSLDSVLLQSTLAYEQKSRILTESSVRTILGPLSFGSSSTMNDYEASKLSMTNMSPHSKEYGSVIMQSSAYELKSSVHTILSSSQKFVTNPVNTISNLIVSVSSPRQTTIYSSSLKATKAAPTTPKMVITTSFIVPRRTTSTVSPIISTSNNDPTTGIKNESTLKNWMKDNMLLVLGISIGVAVVLVVVVIILIVRRKKSNKPQPRPELDPSDLFFNRRVTLLLGPDDELMPDMQPAVTHSNPLYSSEFVERKHSNYTGNRDSHFC